MGSDARPDPARPDLRGTRVLVTGAGGPAAVAFLQSVERAGAEVWAVDIDPYAAGLYLVDREHRALVPRGDSDGFVDAIVDLTARWGIEVVVPTVDVESLPVVRALTRFDELGARVLAPSRSTLEGCLDKWGVIEKCRHAVDVPRTEVLGGGFDTAAWDWPAIAKPRQGSGSRGVTVIDCAEQLAGLPADGSYIVQELLPGREYSLDVLAYLSGHVAAVVSRSRLKVDSGIAVTGTVDVDAGLEAYGRAVAIAVGLNSVANVQVKLNSDGRPLLLEVNPRFPGSMPLTVASGVDMPALAVADLLGHLVPSAVAYRPLAMVRTWTETFFDPAELLELEGRPR